MERANWYRKRVARDLETAERSIASPVHSTKWNQKYSSPTTTSNSPEIYTRPYANCSTADDQRVDHATGDHALYELHMAAAAEDVDAVAKPLYTGFTSPNPPAITLPLTLAHYATASTSPTYGPETTIQLHATEPLVSLHRKIEAQMIAHYPSVLGPATLDRFAMRTWVFFKVDGKPHTDREEISDATWDSLRHLLLVGRVREKHVVAAFCPLERERCPRSEKRSASKTVPGHGPDNPHGDNFGAMGTHVMAGETRRRGEVAEKEEDDDNDGENSDLAEDFENVRLDDEDAGWEQILGEETDNESDACKTSELRSWLFV
ncbi:hypothetical protein MBLNU459_g5182t1 [Dothideomycetes sp. NU459]